MRNLKNWFGQSKLRCAAVTPVGPGHAERARECRASIEAAWRENRGPFTELDFHFVDDGRGSLGRSKARNVGAHAARDAGADWIFFLDADDLMTPRAFAIFAEYADRFDAVWGLMAIKPPDTADHHIRFPQALTLRSLDELLLLDPFMTLLMGHFVRTHVAIDLPFDEAMDAGEDFDYYIRAWQKYRCTKIAEVLSVNRSDRHSSGPRAATADQWRVAATARLAAGLKENSLERHSTRAIAAANRCSEEAQAFSRARDEAKRDRLLTMSRSLPYRGFVDVSGIAGGSFVLFSNNDDLAALSIGWTGDYLPASTRLWQALAADATIILDIGAYTGYFGLLAARAAPGTDIVCFEPLASNFGRLELNLQLNDARNVRALRMAVAGADAEMELRVFARGDCLQSDAALLDDGRPAVRGETVRTMRIDSFLKAQGNAAPGLIRIDAGAIAGDIVGGLAEMPGGTTRDLLIARDGAGAEKLNEELRRRGYRFYAINEERSDVAGVERLAPVAASGDVHWWVTARSGEDAARIIAAAYCNPGRVAER
jgi:FkbM family methyltransferase